MGTTTESALPSSPSSQSERSSAGFAPEQLPKLTPNKRRPLERRYDREPARLAAEAKSRRQNQIRSSTAVSVFFVMVTISR